MIDQILTVLLKTSMAVGGICGLLLDNLIPGTPEERGLVAWRQHPSLDETGEECQTASIHVYDLPFGLNRLSSFKVAKYLRLYHTTLKVLAALIRPSHLQ